MSRRSASHSGGTLTQVSGSPYTVGPPTRPSLVGIGGSAGPFSMGRLLFFAIDCFSIDSDTGALSLLGFPLLESSPDPQIALPSGPASSALPMATDPSGKFLYVLTQTPGPVTALFFYFGIRDRPDNRQPYPGSGLAVDPARSTLRLNGDDYSQGSVIGWDYIRRDDSSRFFASLRMTTS